VFERRVREILSELPNRNFKKFRTRIIPFIKDLRSGCKKSYKKDDIFSIHRGNYYLKSNPDIKKVWNKVPRKSPQKKNGKKVEESNLMPGTPSTDCPTPNTLYPSDDVVTENNQDQNQMEIESLSSSNKKEEDAKFIEELINFPNWELFRDMDQYFSSEEMEKLILSSDILNDDVSFSNPLSDDYYKI